MDKTWFLEEGIGDYRSRLGRAAVYTLGNGYLGCRGFFEEEQAGEPVESLGGIYMAGVFGKGALKAWDGMHRELVNTPNFLWTSILIDGEQVLLRPANVRRYRRVLDMKRGVLVRSYVWTSPKTGKKAKISFERFMSFADLHHAGQRVAVEAMGEPIQVRLSAGIDAGVTQHNMVTTLPLPIQPGRPHLQVVAMGDDTIAAKVFTLPDGVAIHEGQQLTFRVAGGHSEKVAGDSTASRLSTRFTVKLAGDGSLAMTKVATFFTSRDGDAPRLLLRAMADAPSYDELLARHEAVWAAKWESADVRVEGADEDQRAIRYNLFQLMAASPAHDDRVSLGARGLSGEMHEGSVFWDNELFTIPFFTFTDPAATRSMLRWRHNVLPAARKHAKELWFEGAMFPWKSGVDGIEETEMGVGAYYAIHIIADIAYAIRQYWNATGDVDFLYRYGVEILLETARFWMSRMQYNPAGKYYEIRSVRGPNEYDTVVHNNAFTNYQVQENFRTALDAIALMKKERPAEWKKLAAKCKFSDAEGAAWKKAIGKILIPKMADGTILEDDAYLLRAPFDKKRGKPTAARVVDGTLPLEAMAFYQITKQSDVLTLLNLYQDRFDAKDTAKAYDFYEPRTVHDSSLSFGPHAVAAARIGRTEDAYRYFRECAYLDIVDTQLNSISGVHFANLGGTWQAALMGFGGFMPGSDGTFCLDPHLPKAWKSLSFRLHLRGSVVDVKVSKGNQVELALVEAGPEPVALLVNGKKQTLK